MPANLTAGNFRIVSRADKNHPVGVDETLPGFQFVFLNASIRFWKFSSADDVDDDKYLLSIGGYPFTGIIDDKVAANINPEDQVTWKFTFHEFEVAYTITLADDPSRGWTVNSETGEVEIRPIFATASIPPQFQESQLFLIEPFLA